MAKYWRSLEEYYEQPSFREYLEREFPAAASVVQDGVSRRRWLQVMGASLTLAGVAGCRWEDQKIATYVSRPVNRIPGIPVKYATLLERAGVALGVLATSFDGRPIKLDVNAEHPQGFSGTDGQIQGSVLQLYDPDRIARDTETGKHDNLYDPRQTAVLRENTDSGRKARTWEQFEEFAADWLASAKQSNGDGVFVLAGASSSPSRARLQQQLLAELPSAQWLEYEPVSRDHEWQASQQAFGERLRVQYHLDKADVVIGLDSDLLDFHPEALRHVKEWSSRRVPEAGEMNRTYAIESCYSLLGQNADHRFPLASSEIAAFAADLHDALQSALSGTPQESNQDDQDPKRSLLNAMVDDLIHHKGHSVIVAGPNQPVEVHAACLHLNSLLENFGSTITAVNPGASERSTHTDSINQLTEALKSGEVETLIVLGGNPVYNTPAELGLSELIANVPVSMRLGLYDDETADLCQWYAPETHDLEAWGDGRSWDGTFGVRQPLVDPLHRGLSEIEFLAVLLQQETRDGQQIVKETLASLRPEMKSRDWEKLVHDGYLADSAYPQAALQLADSLVALVSSWLEQAGQSAKGEGTAASAEVVYLVDEAVYDGRFANNAWLQETPRNLTKLTWDNVAIISPKTAQQNGLADGDLVKISRGETSITLPVVQIPGTAENTYGISIGYGRTLAGHVGGCLQDEVEPVGQSAYQLMTTSGAGFENSITVTPVGEKFTLATTQNHWSIDVAGMEEIGRRVGALVREGTRTEYEEHNDFAAHRSHMPERLESLWEERGWSEEYQWGMTIDLSRCVGCNACTVSCQAENNIPVVGKDQVKRNREMHWIRIDRYFVTPEGEQSEQDAALDHPANLGVSTQPVTCQQCENAPCEQVCPVAATVHSPEGLNDMAYNRCVGTRYCANNCPYKVRRFNYFSNVESLSRTYSSDTNPQVPLRGNVNPNETPELELVQLVMNPEVTIRSRGVMEKCTYCVQRIQNTKIKAKNEHRLVRDGEIQTACQEACPTDAIVFGNLQDHESQVSKNQQNPRSYAMLGELNVKPRTEYLARIRNPHPFLEKNYFLQPGEHHGHGGHHGDDHDHHGDAHHDDHSHDEHADHKDHHEPEHTSSENAAP